ncbi:hypothetical protein Sru01_18810 [Sphaerisporangium rufum]|uniref:Uncharacterized protein n=1 Tax=Sphaerisporangium rufum TaxID=1381558 RepID=A0A919QZ86_9ACTN|nr:hypothetical protein [Sphaerisporangium rufum]GII76899.1 hypothetical protein Sru01_18810 [Sphaerisporangium rufum]
MPALHVEAAHFTGHRPAATVRQVAADLQAHLARRNIPSYVYFLDDGHAAVALWQGLLARVDGRVIWWTSPRRSVRGRALRTFAVAPATAACRLAEHYSALRAHPLPGPGAGTPG